MNKAGLLAAIAITLGGIPTVCLKQADNLALCARQGDEIHHVADDIGDAARHADDAARQVDGLKHADETSREDFLMDAGIEGGKVAVEEMADSEENQ
jgi:hypothetical protein